MKRKIKVPKERNPFVAHVATKRSGAHGKTNKALRRAEKIKLMDRQLSWLEHSTFNRNVLSSNPTRFTITLMIHQQAPKRQQAVSAE